MANKIFILLIIIILSLPLFLPNIIGTDVFYHFKTSQNLIDFEIDNHLSHIISPTNLDHHFLHHILMAPFTFFGFPLGVKLFNLFFNLLFFITFIWFFKKFNLSRSYFWFFILITSSSLFLNRINLGRTQTISIIFLLLIIYSLIKNKRWLLFILSFFYVWLFNGFIIIFIPLFIFFVIHWFKNTSYKYAPLFSIFGLLSGITINPFFPENLFFLFQHSFIMPINNILTEKIPVGIEWSSYPFINFIFDNITLIILMVFFSLTLSLLFILKTSFKIPDDKKNIIIFLFISALILFVLTMKSFRFIEYFLPLTIILFAFIYDFLHQLNLPTDALILLKQIKEKLKKPFFVTIISLSTILLLLFPIKNLYSDYSTTPKITTFKETATWLKDNTPKDSIVFNGSWDAYPKLFFYNNHNRYLIGLDPTFMYLYDSKLYWQWRNISDNICTADFKIESNCPIELSSPEIISKTIKSNFSSEYIWLENSDNFFKLKKFLETNPEFFKLMIETNDSSVFKIIGN